MKIYNEAKYLEPPLPFRSSVRHISKHLPREVQITLMMREVTEINELEKVLDIFQNIRDREMGSVRIRQCHTLTEVIINLGGQQPHIEVRGETIIIEMTGRDVRIVGSKIIL